MPVEREPELLGRPDRVVVWVGLIRRGRGRGGGGWRRRWVETGDFVEVERVEDVVVVALDAGGDVLVGQPEDCEPEG